MVTGSGCCELDVSRDDLEAQSLEQIRAFLALSARFSLRRRDVRSLQVRAPNPERIRGLGPGRQRIGAAVCDDGLLGSSDMADRGVSADGQLKAAEYHAASSQRAALRPMRAYVENARGNLSAAAINRIFQREIRGLWRSGVAAPGGNLGGIYRFRNSAPYRKRNDSEVRQRRADQRRDFCGCFAHNSVARSFSKRRS